MFHGVGATKYGVFLHCQYFTYVPMNREEWTETMESLSETLKSEQSLTVVSELDPTASDMDSTASPS